MRRCAVAPLRRCAVASCLDYDATGRAGFVPLLCSCAQCNGATEQRSNGAELRCCGTDALARSNGARSSGAELRRCGTEHRHGGSEQSNGARSNGGELRRCGQSARSTEHGAEHRSTERSNLEDACSTRNEMFPAFGIEQQPARQGSLETAHPCMLGKTLRSANACLLLRDPCSWPQPRS